MSRMGDTIRASRVKYGLSEKQLAKKTGLAESFIKDVEAGKRIPSDDQAKRMLKACGVTQSVGTEIDTANEPEVRLRPKPRPYIIPVPEDEPEPPETYSFILALVAEPQTPSAVSPLLLWNSFTAALVWLPK